MAKQRTTSKRGLPKALELELEQELLDEEAKLHEPTLDEFVKDMHGETGPTQSQSDMPSLDWLKTEFVTKSAAIRYLINQGHSVLKISKHLGVRYQQVRNVSVNKLKRGPNEDWTKPYHRQPSTTTPTTEDDNT